MAKDSYNPHGKTIMTLDRAFDLVQSVPYQVSARWVFYRLLQEGFYSTKTDYNNKFLPALSDARHAFYKDWRPDTLSDETREALVLGRGFLSEREWLTALADQVECNLDYWQTQPCYVEAWFEARAMTDQFRHYTDYVTLRPMGGHPSIPYKWKIAKDLENAANRYGVPIVVLYFGDLDKAGQTICDSLLADVREWCDVDFDLIRAGLTAEQVALYQVPENFEKPGEYQWEALPDDAASQIITSDLNQFIRQDLFSQVEQKQDVITRWTRAQLKVISAEWK